MSRRLVIIGASGRAAAMSAWRAGWQPCVVDLFADADVVRRFPCLRAEGGASAWVARALEFPPSPCLYTGGLENHPEAVERLGRHHHVLGNPPDVLRRVRDPAAVQEALRACGLPWLVVRASDVPPPSGRFLCKPRSSGGGQRVWLHEPHHDHPAVEQSSAGHYWQQFVRGSSYSATYLAAGGRAVLLGVTRQWSGSRAWGVPRFLYAGSRTCIRPPCDPELLRAVGACMARTFELRGLFGLDLVCAGRTCFVVEVNPRYTASCELLDRSLQESLVDAHSRACLEGILPEPRNGQKAARCLGKAIVYARTTVTVREEWIERWWRAVQTRRWPPLSDLPVPGTRFEPGDPVMTVFATARRPHELHQRLTRRINAVHAVCSPFATWPLPRNKPNR